MWPIYFLFNKILNTGDERELKDDNLTAIDPYLFQQPSSNIDSHPPSLRRSQFIEEELPNDLVRVDTLFQKAMEAGIDIQCRSISGEEISVLMLSGKYIAIALVDHSKLSHAWQDVPVPGVFSNNSGYTGHYVLLCGYDAEADMFEIRDPASSKKHKRISSKSLEEARKAFGTDEDLLLISLEKSNTLHQPSLQLTIDVNTNS